MCTDKVDFSTLDQRIAKKIIETVGGNGVPPEYGFQYFTVGLGDYLNTIEEEYLKDYIKSGGSSFKLVVGSYGFGKTHFLYCVRDIAWKYGYITSLITLTPGQTPFHKLEQVYKEMVLSLVYPQEPEKLLQGYDKGIEAVIKKWYRERREEYHSKLPENIAIEALKDEIKTLSSYESTSFRNAVGEAFLSLLEERLDDFSLIVQWLKGENPPRTVLKKFNIFEKIDKSNAFRMIRSLVKWLIDIGYSGLVVLLDEGEQTSSMSSKEKELLLNNLRQIIDACAESALGNTMWFYAVPDLSFLGGRTQIYEALNQRLRTFFRIINPSGVRIDLDKITDDRADMLRKIGEKLAQIYKIAYGVEFDSVTERDTIDNFVQHYTSESKYDPQLKRHFVQDIIRAFHQLKHTGNVVTPEDIEENI